MTSTTILELTRSLHQEIESKIEKASQLMIHEFSSRKDTVIKEHKIKNLIEDVQNLSQKLLDIYMDRDGVREQELKQISGDTVFTSFYDRLNSIKTYYRKNPNEDFTIPSMTVLEDFIPIKNTENHLETLEALKKETEKIDEEKVEALFLGEEHFGNFIDLNIFYQKFMNLKLEKYLPKMVKSTNQNEKEKPLDYISYLGIFNEFMFIPENIKLWKSYRNYLNELMDYLINFIKRSRPLFNLKRAMEIIHNDFKQGWENGYFQPKWKKTNQNDGNNQSKKNVDDNEVNQNDQILITNENKKSEELNHNHLYCEYCKKQFAKDTVFQVHLKGKKHQKNMNRKIKQEENKMKSFEEFSRYEFIITKLTQILHEVIKKTIENTVRKQTLTYEELQREILDAEEEDNHENADENADEDIEDDEDMFYNPKGLPLGWDGKPIPYWLYKLNGLSVEYRCEICGGFTYRGRKTFEDHFQQWRHAHAMKCLGIPNTKHFHEITSIDEALALYKKIKDSLDEQRFKPDEDEEFEDSQGNVISRKTYELMKKQGIL
ncbi:splicing factor 3a subunit 3 [Anaeramoeba ignava]|uniref:Splicing factor 3a subunit 3 n=1 Tax=Anaeramoeba ignava TaxID=1746090 RepID=A0A9Q0L705_ANAIG|nr:splicing factor 3a subunit 3 [Anaeramoeba ignava]